MDKRLLYKFIIIIIDPERHRFVIPQMHLNHTIPGAIFLDLAKEKMIKPENGKILVSKNASYGKEEYDYVLDKVSQKTKAKSLKYWIKRFGQSSKLKKMCLNNMLKEGLIDMRTKKYLGFIPCREFINLYPAKRENFICDLKEKIQEKDAVFSAEDIHLIALIKACKAQKIFAFKKQERKEINKKMKLILAKSSVAGDIEKSIKETQAAITAAIAATTVASSAGSS